MESCPSPDLLTQLAQGSLPQEDIERLGSHVGECDLCQHVLASLLDPETTQSVAADYHQRLHLTRGQLVGRYVIISLLGEGGMGSVYLAYDPDLDRKVALKLVQWAALRSTTAAQVQSRLAREAQAMARLSHPNVVAVHDVLMVDGRVYVAMEYVEGGTLRAWMDKTPPPSTSEILAAFIEAGQGLAAAHTAGIIHRDFKPANVLVGTGAHGRIRVTDFGVARAFDANEPEPEMTGLSTHKDNTPSRLSTPMTQVGTVVGTPAYLSPEAYRGEPVSAASDQFSFCVALYEALYGERPFIPGQGLSLEQAVVTGRLNPAPTGNRVPAWVRKILLRGLSGEPGQRYPSMKALLDALRADPLRTRRRRLATAAVVASIVTLTFGITRWLATRDAPCQGNETKLQGIWDDNARTKLAVAFQALQSPQALDALPTVQTLLDRYTQSWVVARQHACEDTAIRHVQSEPLMARRMECLTLKLNDVRDLVRQLYSVDAAMATKAIDAAARLPDLQQCADEAGLAREITLPTEPSLRQDTEAMLEELSGLRNSLNLGNYDQKLLSAHEARMDKIRALNVPGLEPEALLLLGRLELNFIGTERSEKTLQLAVTQALAARRFDLMTLAIHSLLRLKYTQREFQNVHDWMTLGDAALIAAGTPDTLRCQFLGTKAAVLASMEETETQQALALIPQFLESCRRADPDNQFAEGDAEQMVGNIFLSSGRSEEAQAHLEHSLSIYKQLFGPRHELVGLALQNVAANLQTMGRWAEAAEMGTQAATVFEGTQSKALAVYAYRLLCEVYVDLDKTELALTSCEKASAASTEVFGAQSQAHVTGLGLRAVALLKAKQIKEARKLFDRMFSVARELKLERSQETATTYLEYLQTLEMPRERALAKELVDIASAVLTHPTVQGELANIKQWQQQHL